MSSFLQAAEPLTIAAAADLAPLRQELITSIANGTGITVQFTFAGSGVLARQLENGAPYDLYLSANEQFVRELEAKGKVTAATAYASGRLGLWSKSGKYRQVSDLRSAVHIALPNPQLAPYGAAAKAMLEKLGAWKGLEAKIVYGENVQQTLQFAESGNADACITAWSLVAAKGAVQLPAADHPPIRQVGAVVTSGKRRSESAKVLAWLAGPGGRAVLAAHGLGTP